MRFPPALLASIRCLLLGTLAMPLGAAAQASDWGWRYCRLGEPCWDRLIENGDRSIQEKMREAQAAAARIRTPEPQARPKETLAAPARPARAAEAVAAGGKPRPGDAADDMRFWSSDDCATRYDHSASDFQECVAFVTSDAAKQARVDRACRDRFPADANEYERCRLPLQSDATALAAAAAARAAPAADAASALPTKPATAPAPVPVAPANRGAPEAGAGGGQDALLPLGGGLLLIVALALGAVAVRCWKPQIGWPQVYLASCMGLFSGVMFYLLAALTIAGISAPASAAFAMIAVIGGWSASVWLMLNGAVSVARVVNRGFLLGAVEWVLMIPAGLFYAGRAAAASFASTPGAAQSGASLFGSSIGGDLLAFLTGGIAVVMAGVCLVGFAVSYFISGQLEPEAPRAKRKCPECAEMIQAEASKCRYCGAVLKRKAPRKTAAGGGPRTVTHTAARTATRPARGSG